MSAGVSCSAWITSASLGAWSTRRRTGQSARHMHRGARCQFHHLNIIEYYQLAYLVRVFGISLEPINGIVGRGKCKGQEAFSS